MSYQLTEEEKKKLLLQQNIEQFAVSNGNNSDVSTKSSNKLGLYIGLSVMGVIPLVIISFILYNKYKTKKMRWK